MFRPACGVLTCGGMTGTGNGLDLKSSVPQGTCEFDSRSLLHCNTGLPDYIIRVKPGVHMRHIKQFTFGGRKFKISWTGWIGGFTNSPEGSPAEMDREIVLIDGDTLKHFHAVVHEALEAYGIPSEHLHDANGDTKTEDLSRFIWTVCVAPLRKKRKDHR